MPRNFEIQIFAAHPAVLENEEEIGVLREYLVDHVAANISKLFKVKIKDFYEQPLLEGNLFYLQN